MNDFETIFRYAGAGMALVAPNGDFLKVNPALTRFLQIAEDELLKKKFVEVIHPDDIAADTENFQNLLNGTIEAYTAEKRFKINGHFVWGLLTAAAAEDGRYIINEIQNIDCLKKKEEKLVCLSERLTQIADNIEEVFWVCNSKAEVVYCSPAYEIIWGKSRQAIYENPTDWLNSIVDEHREAVASAFYSAFECGYFMAEYQILRPDGTRRWIRDRGKLAKDVIVGVAHDVTRMKIVREELKNFAYAASHDLREPLRIINGYAYLIQSTAQTLPPTFCHYVNNIVDATNRMSEMLDGLLAYSRIDREQKYDILNLGDVISTARKNLSNKIEETKTIFKIKGNATIKGVKGQLIQVFQNLFDNAIKYRHLDRTPCIEVSINQNNTYINIAIKDNGIGIEEKNYQKAFQIFKQLHPKETYEGRGIGLALVRQIVDHHQGQIWLKSVVGEGTIFYVSLPINLEG